MVTKTRGTEEVREDRNDFDHTADAEWLDRLADDEAKYNGEAQGRRRLAGRQAKNGDGKDSSSTTMVTLALAAGAEPFHDRNQTAYATVPVADHKETWPLKSNGFKR